MTAIVPRRRAVWLTPLIRPARGVAMVVVLLAVWQVVGQQELIAFVVPFTDALSGAWELVTSDRLASDVLPSAGRALAGFGLGSLVGYAIGMVLGVAPKLEQWTRPALELARAIPVPILIPVLFATFGADSATRIGLIALAASWPVLLNAADGARAVDVQLVDAARVAGFGPVQRLGRIIAPASLPQVFAGLRISLGLSLVMMVVSEMVSATSGLGQFVLQAQRSFAINDMYSGVLVLATLGGIFTAAFTLVERRVLGWYLGQKGMSHD